MFWRDRQGNRLQTICNILIGPKLSGPLRQALEYVAENQKHWGWQGFLCEKHMERVRRHFLGESRRGLPAEGLPGKIPPNIARIGNRPELPIIDPRGSK